MIDGDDDVMSLETLSEDPLANEILRVERCLSVCDRIDILIIRGLHNKLTRAAVAESVFISERAVGYRLKKLCSVADATTRRHSQLCSDRGSRIKGIANERG